MLAASLYCSLLGTRHALHRVGRHLAALRMGNRGTTRAGASGLSRCLAVLAHDGMQLSAVLACDGCVGLVHGVKRKDSGGSVDQRRGKEEQDHLGGAGEDDRQTHEGDVASEEEGEDNTHEEAEGAHQHKNGEQNHQNGCNKREGSLRMVQACNKTNVGGTSGTGTCTYRC